MRNKKTTFTYAEIKKANERLKKLLAEAEAKYNEAAKRFYKLGIKDFAHTFTERFIIILNLNYEQANVARQCEEELVKEMVGANDE